MSHSDATGIFINETHTAAAIWQYRVEKMLLEGKTQYLPGETIEKGLLRAPIQMTISSLNFFSRS